MVGWGLVGGGRGVVGTINIFSFSRRDPKINFGTGGSIRVRGQPVRGVVLSYIHSQGCSPDIHIVRGVVPTYIHSQGCSPDIHIVMGVARHRHSQGFSPDIHT